MKRLFLALLILLTSSPIFAQEQLARMNLGVVGGGVPAEGAACADTSCTGFLVCQNFETSTTGYDNSETWGSSGAGATIDPVYTTTHLRGSQSLRITRAGANVQVYNTSGSLFDAPEAYIHFLYRTDTIPTDTTRMLLRGITTGSATLFTVELAGSGDGNSGALRAYGPATVITTDVLSANTQYHIWIHYKESSGASDGIFSIEFTADATRVPAGSGNKFNGVTNHNIVNHMIQWMARITIDSMIDIYDQILIKATSIGTVCE
jgi:hypothetical protein